MYIYILSSMSMNHFKFGYVIIVHQKFGDFLSNIENDRKCRINIFFFVVLDVI